MHSCRYSDTNLEKIGPTPNQTETKFKGGELINKWTVIIGIFLIPIMIFSILYPVYRTPIKESVYSSYDTDWNDLSILRDSLDQKNKTIMTSPILLTEIKDPKDTILFIIGAEKGYSELELDIIEDYIKSGGKIILANNNNILNSVSQLYGVSFYHEKVLDPTYLELEEHNYTIFQQNATLDGNNYTIHFNSPTGLEVERGVIICKSSPNSSLDINGNNLRDLVDKRGPIPLIAISDRNSNGGQIVFISSPSLFINQDINKADNLEFVKALLNFLMNIERTPLNTNSEVTLPSKVVRVESKPEPIIIFDESRHIQPRDRQVVYNTITFFAYTSKYPIFVVIIFINIACISIFWWLSNPRPKPFRHVDRLSESNQRGTQNINDTAYIREILLLKLLISRPIENDPSIFWLPDLESKLKTWKRDRLEKLLGDTDLVDLVLKTKITKKDLKKIRDKVIRWNYDSSK